MFSIEWFDTFAAKVTEPILQAELDGICRTVPLAQYPRILDVGCGIGRIAGPLAARGYSVTGIDVSLDALRAAHLRAPGPRYLALDQRHIGRMRWEFDAVLVLWHSLGFVSPAADVETLTGVATALRPGGLVALELFHPEWLQDNERTGEADARGAASVRRWVHRGRCYHEIRYVNGAVDRIEFSVYTPVAMRELAAQAGLESTREMVWWDQIAP